MDAGELTIRANITTNDVGKSISKLEKDFSAVSKAVSKMGDSYASSFAKCVKSMKALGQQEEKISTKIDVSAAKAAERIEKEYQDHIKKIKKLTGKLGEEYDNIYGKDKKGEDKTRVRAIERNRWSAERMRGRASQLRSEAERDGDTYYEHGLPKSRTKKAAQLETQAKALEDEALDLDRKIFAKYRAIKAEIDDENANYRSRGSGATLSAKYLKNQSAVTQKREELQKELDWVYGSTGGARNTNIEHAALLRTQASSLRDSGEEEKAIELEKEAAEIEEKALKKATELRSQLNELIENGVQMLRDGSAFSDNEKGVSAAADYQKLGDTARERAEAEERAKEALAEEASIAASLMRQEDLNNGSAKAGDEVDLSEYFSRIYDSWDKEKQEFFNNLSDDEKSSILDGIFGGAADGEAAFEEMKRQLEELKSLYDELAAAEKAAQTRKALFSTTLSTLKSIDNFGSRISGTVVQGLKIADKHANRFGMTLANSVREAVMKRFKKLNKSVDGSGKSFKHALKNILRYGLGIRSLFVLFNRLRNMIKSGIGSIVQYSSSADKSISNLVNAFKQFKTSVSVAFLPIIQTVEPAITRLINLLARAMNAVAAFFATLSGSTVFLRAKERVDSYAKSLKGAGAAQKYFSGLDEVRTFENGGGGGGGVDSPFKMFEWSDVTAGVSEFAEKVKQAWRDADFTEIGKIVGDKMTAAIAKIDLTNLKTNLRKIASSVATFFNGLADTDLFTVAGTKVSDALNMIAETVKTFATRADWGSWAKAITSGINSAINGISETDIASAFARVFNGVNTYINEFWGSIDFSGLGEKIKNGITLAITETDFKAAGESVLAKFNGVLDLVSSAVSGFDFSRVGTAIADFFNGMFESVDRAKLLEAAKNIVNGIGDAIGSALSNISIGSVISSVGEFAAGVIEAIAKKLEDNEEVIVNAVADILSGLSKAVKKCTAALLKLGKEILTVIWRGITENLSGGVSIGSSIVQGIADGIGANSSAVVIALSAIVTGFVTLKSAIAAMDLIKAGSKIAGFASELATAGGSIATAATGVGAFGTAIGTVGTAISTALPFIAIAAGTIGLITAAVVDAKQSEEEWQQHLDGMRQEAATLPDEIQTIVDSLHREAEAYALAQEASQQKISAIADESKGYSDLLSKLDECVEADGKIKDGKEVLANFIVTQLKESFGIEIDIIDGVIQGYEKQKQTIQEVIAQKKLAAMVSVLDDDFGEAILNYDKYKESLDGINSAIIDKKGERAEAWTAVKDATNELAAANANLYEEMSKPFPNEFMLDELTTKAIDAENALKEAQATYDGTNEALEVLQGSYNETAGVIAGYESTLETYTLAQQLSAQGLTEAAAYVAEHGAASYKDYAEGVMKSLTDAAQSAQDYYDSIKDSSDVSGEVIAEAKTAAENAWQEVETQYDNFFGAGKFVSEGLAEGLRNGEVDIIDATRAAADDSLKEIKEAYGIASPSKVMAEIGMFLDQGLAQGITENEDDIKNALVSATEKALTSMKEVIDGADMDIGKTLKDTNGELSERSGVLTSLTDAYTRAASSMKSANNELSKLTAPVLDAADAIELAGTNFGKTDTAVTEASNNISKAVTQKFKETSEIVYETFDGMTTKVGDFAFDAQEQWDRGMRSADFSKELVKAINAAISAAETALKGAYTKFYNCGAYIGKGLYDGLVSYKTSLIKAMQDVINGIKDTVTVTMKIASPSKVMYQLGEYISEGLANGIGDEGRKVLSTAGKLSNDTLAQFKDIERLDALQALQNIQVPTPALSYGNIIPPKTVVSIESLDTIEDKLTAILNKMEQIKASDNGSAANEYTFNATINRKVLFSEIIEEAKLSQIKNGKNPFALGW